LSLAPWQCAVCFREKAMETRQMTIDTPRLRLVPYAPQDILAILDGYEPFAASFGTAAAEGLHEMYGSGDVSPAWLAQLRTCTSADPWQHGWAVVHKARGLVIGSVGFKGPPDGEGVAELAYGIVPSFQGQGHATEAAQGAIAWALADNRVQLLRAHTLPAANASTHVLAKCGFDFVGEVHDPEDGLVWRWERTV
jgi:[ribosomal protein S5]-alanine N-acetyltransferase